MKFVLVSLALAMLACTTFGCHASGGVDVDKSVSHVSLAR